MAKATKTFKIGEYCRGGVITAEVNGNKVSVIGKDWDTSKGFNKGSDQSNAKEFDRRDVDATHSNARRELDDFLCDLTTSYYAGQVLEWIETKVKFASFW